MTWILFVLVPKNLFCQCYSHRNSILFEIKDTICSKYMMWLSDNRKEILTLTYACSTIPWAHVLCLITSWLSKCLVTLTLWREIGVYLNLCRLLFAVLTLTDLRNIAWGLEYIQVHHIVFWNVSEHFSHLKINWKSIGPDCLALVSYLLRFSIVLFEHISLFYPCCFL